MLFESNNFYPYMNNNINNNNQMNGGNIFSFGSGSPPSNFCPSTSIRTNNNNNNNISGSYNTLPPRSPYDHLHFAPATHGGSAAHGDQKKVKPGILILYLYYYLSGLIFLYLKLTLLHTLCMIYMYIY